MPNTTFQDIVEVFQTNQVKRLDLYLHIGNHGQFYPDIGLLSLGFNNLTTQEWIWLKPILDRSTALREINLHDDLARTSEGFFLKIYLELLMTQNKLVAQIEYASKPSNYHDFVQIYKTKGWGIVSYILGACDYLTYPHQLMAKLVRENQTKLKSLKHALSVFSIPCSPIRPVVRPSPSLWDSPKRAISFVYGLQTKPPIGQSQEVRKNLARRTFS